MTKTKPEIIAATLQLAEACFAVAVDADYYGGFDADMVCAKCVLLQVAYRLAELANSVEVTG